VFKFTWVNLDKRFSTLNHVNLSFVLCVQYEQNV